MHEDVYFTIIGNKTSSLMASSCALGALSVKESSTTIHRMKELGEALGMAFQIKDDLLDFVGDKQKLGKPVGNDILENKITLPLIAALRNADNGKRTEVLKKLGDGADEDDVKEVVEFLNQYL